MKTPRRSARRTSRGQQFGAERVAFKACADTANLSVPEQSTNLGDEIAVLSCRGKRLHKNLQLTIAPVETLGIKRQQHGRIVMDHLLPVTGNFFLEAATTQNT